MFGMLYKAGQRRKAFQLRLWVRSPPRGKGGRDGRAHSCASGRAGLPLPLLRLVLVLVLVLVLPAAVAPALEPVLVLLLLLLLLLEPKPVAVLVLVLVLTLAVVAVQVMDGAKVSYFKLGDHQPKGSFHVHMIKGCKQVDIMKESQRCDHATQTAQRNPATRHRALLAWGFAAA